MIALIAAFLHGVGVALGWTVVVVLLAYIAIITKAACSAAARIRVDAVSARDES